MLENAFEITGKGENKILLLYIELWNSNYKTRRIYTPGATNQLRRNFPTTKLLTVMTNVYWTPILSSALQSLLLMVFIPLLLQMEQLMGR